MRRLARPIPLWALAPALIAGAALGLGLGVNLESSRETAAEATPVSASASPTAVADPDIQSASKLCGIPMNDGGRTLIVDGKGSDAKSGSADITKISCVLSAVHAPQAVITQMNQTRALDGRQEADWSHLHASWSYSPSTGLDIIITAP